MAIIDYRDRARWARDKLLTDKSITDTNKAHLRAHAEQYELRVTPARVGIFYAHIRTWMLHSKDFAEEMHDRDKVLAIAKQVREECASDATYCTVISVVHTLARWLNDGEKPKGMRDLKRPSERSTKRRLQAKDMLLWEEGEAIAREDKSIQMQALFLTQLDGGFRPSELTNLNYGDIEVSGQFAKVQVAKGKTGGRQAWLFRAVPALARWLNAHPTKKAGDPLWMLEYVKSSHRDEGKVAAAVHERYNYPAIVKRIKRMFRDAGIDKPSDVYSLRHSSITQGLRDGMQASDLSAKHGTSVKNITDTYGHLVIEDHLDRAAQAYGVKHRAEDGADNPVTCPRCEASNDHAAELCERCGAPMRLDVAVRQAASMEERMARMEEQLAAFVNAQLDQGGVITTVGDDGREVHTPVVFRR